jgi:uncharacterized protein YdcH (DUF465 family)
MYNWFNYSRVKKQLESQLAENAALREENKNLEDILKSIEQDGTEEHNNAIKLRQENAKLKDEIAKWEKSWEEAASDLALRVIKLEKQIEELKIVNITNPYSAMKPDGTLKAINCVGHIPTNGYVPSNQDAF